MKTFAFIALLLSSASLVGLNFSNDFDKDLQKTLAAIKNADSLEALNNSPDSPNNLFHNLSEIKALDQTSLCESLEGLKNNDLALLENSLSEHKESLKLDCFETITKRINRFHAVQSRVFYQAVEKDNVFLKQQDKKTKSMAWSPFNQINSIGPKQTYFFKGTTAVKKGSVIYQKDLVTGSSDINTLQLAHGEIVLTFDDGPHPSRTQLIADTLDRHQVKAIFFAVGKNARAMPAVIKNVLSRDNVYGSHSDTHQQLTKISQAAAQTEIRQGHLSVVAAANSEDSGFFRFPYGARNTDLAAFVKNNTLSSFYWNMDSLDWKYSDNIVLYNQIVKEINRQQRGVILFHDIHQQTVTVLDQVLEKLYEAGYSIRLAVPSEWIEAR